LIARNRKSLLASTMMAGLALTAPGLASAQTAPQGNQVEEVVVTGSLIRRNPLNSPTPLIQVGQEEIQQSGEINIVDYLADIPALQNSQVYEDTTGGFVGIGGLAFLNLRNLGAARTLVLVDGRRHVAGDPGGASVDVDTIPSSLVRRVEVTTGAGSALYGADAVSGVVNFIMRDDYEGVEMDAAIGQLAQNTSAYNKKLSLTAGKNFMDGRLNVYGYAETQRSDVLNDRDLAISWVRKNSRLVTLDVDPTSAVNDSVFDVDRRFNLRSLNRPLGGVLVLANGTPGSITTDPDIPYGACATTQANSATFAANCFATNPGKTYQFRADGTPYLADFGAGQTAGAVNRTTTIGGSGDALSAVETNRLPKQKADRFQVGLNFDVKENVKFFSELKYVEETNVDVFQPHFANVNIRAFGATEYPNDYSALTSFTIGLDNAYLPGEVRNAIVNNQRTVYGAPSATAGSAVTGTVNDRRALLRVFSYDLGYRPSIAERNTTRFVGGFRGDFEQLSFVKDVSWELGYTYGKMKAVNTEPETIDVERYAYSIDAVVDTAGELGTAGAVVCRVQLLAKRGVQIKNLDGVAYSANDPTIAGCKPSRVFGTGGFADSKDYITTSLVTKEMNEQHDVRGFASGNLWDFWGAGPIGVAVGGEYRKEQTSADLTDFGDRVLFGNSGGDLAKIGFSVKEGFGEVRLPLLKNMFLAENLEVSGNYRYSDYSTIGSTKTWGVNGLWRPVRDVAFRFTYGKAVRAPTLSELYDPPFDTFPSLTDPCSAPIIAGTTDPRIRNNRIKNCALLGIPTSYVDPNPGFSNNGTDGSNPNLKAEKSTSHTISAIITPRWTPRLSIVLDYYDIKITDAISTLSAQTLANLCVDEDVLNTTACAAVPRRPASSGPDAYEIDGFTQGPFNFAALLSRGMDFTIKYNFEPGDLFGGKEWGRLDLGVTGNYLIRRQDFTNPTVKGLATNLDTTTNNPRVRFRTTATWSKGPLALTWRADYQTAQELFNYRLVGENIDSREKDYFDTGSFLQQDISFRYDVSEKAYLRGGVNNVFDAEPNVQTGFTDNFDLFGRRFHLGVNMRF
jgi:outer membrane receptor protein involved in Fe transport